MLAWLDGLIESLHKNVPKAFHEFDADAIHDARVSTRRMKAAMDLLKPLLREEDRECFEKVLKKLRKRLGPLRDLDVMIESLEKLKDNPASQWLRDQLARERDETREDSRKKVSAARVLGKVGAWWAVRDQIVDAGDAVDSLMAQSLHRQLDAFSEQAMKMGGEDPHQLRISGKLLRYTLEMAKAQGHKLPGSVLRIFKKMQDELGTWHDHVVLVERVMQTSLDHGLSYHQPELEGQLLKLAQLFLTRAQRDLAGFEKLWQQHGGEIEQTIRDKFPLTPGVSAPQTGPGPLDSGDMPAPEAATQDATSTA